MIFAGGSGSRDDCNCNRRSDSRLFCELQKGAAASVVGMSRPKLEMHDEIKLARWPLQPQPQSPAARGAEAAASVPKLPQLEQPHSDFSGESAYQRDIWSRIRGPLWSLSSSVNSDPQGRTCAGRTFTPHHLPTDKSKLQQIPSEYHCCCIEGLSRTDVVDPVKHCAIRNDLLFLRNIS